MAIFNDGNYMTIPKALCNDFLDVLSYLELKTYLFIAEGTYGDVDGLCLKLHADTVSVVTALSNLKKNGLIDFSSDLSVITLIEKPGPVKREIEPSLMLKIEQIKGSPLSTSEVDVFDFICSDLAFSEELLLYLCSYCKERDKFSASYVRAIAISWQSKGIDTVSKAKVVNRRYDDIVYMALSHLGRNDYPTPAEANIVSKWHNAFGMSDELILFGCDKTSIATAKNRLLYADKLFCSWHESNITTVEGLTVLNTSNEAPINSSRGLERTYDFEELERQLLDN